MVYADRTMTLFVRRYRGHCADALEAEVLFHLHTELVERGSGAVALVVSTVGDVRLRHERKGDVVGPKRALLSGALYESSVWCVDDRRRRLGRPLSVKAYATESDAEAGHEALCAHYEALSLGAVRRLLVGATAREGDLDEAARGRGALR